MRSPRLLLVPAAAAAALVSGCIGVDPGPATTERRDVGAFTRVSADDQVDVNLTAGDRRSVHVRAGEKVIDDVRTEVRDDTLYVTYDGPGIRDGRLVVEASAPTFDAVSVAGAADVRLEGLDQDDLDIRVSGAGDITADGRTDALTLDISGSGDADLSELHAAAARVDLTGAGDADVFASERLDAEIDGAGDLLYRGDPRVDQRVDGSGDIEHVG